MLSSLRMRYFALTTLSAFFPTVHGQALTIHDSSPEELESWKDFPSELVQVTPQGNYFSFATSTWSTFPTSSTTTLPTATSSSGLNFLSDLLINMGFESGISDGFGQVFLYVAIGLGILSLVVLATCLRWWYMICCCGRSKKNKVKVKVDTKVDTNIKNQMNMAQSSKPSIVYQSQPPIAFMVPPAQMVSCVPMSTNVPMGVTYPMGTQVGCVQPVHHGFGGPINPMGYPNVQVLPGNPMVHGQQMNQMVYPNQMSQLPPNQQICSQPGPETQQKRASKSLKTRVFTFFRKLFSSSSKKPDMVQNVYTAQMTQSSYNVPMAQTNYNAPMAQNNCDAQMAQNNYNAQMAQNNCNAQMPQNNCNAQMAQNNCNAQMPQNNCNAPRPENKYNAQLPSGYPVQQSQCPQNEVNRGHVMNVNNQATGTTDNQVPINQVNNIGASPNQCPENGNKV